LLHLSAFFGGKPVPAKPGELWSLSYAFSTNANADSRPTVPLYSIQILTDGGFLKSCTDDTSGQSNLTDKGRALFVYLNRTLGGLKPAEFYPVAGRPEFIA
jgi:hypothetical protein